MLESVDEQSSNWLTEMFERLFGVPHVAESAYVRHLVNTVLALGAHGQCVIVGRGAAVILPRNSTLRVRLVAPLEHRIAVLRKRLSLDDKAARDKALEVDKQRSEFVRNNFHCESAAPTNYDLVLNTDTFSNGACAELIIEALHRRQKVSAAGH